MNRRRIVSLAACAAVMAVAAGLYGPTLGRFAYWGDSMELTAAAAVLGIPHPPGYPLYALVGHCAQWIAAAGDGAGAGRADVAMNALSALCMAVAGVLFFGFLGELFRTRGRGQLSADAMGDGNVWGRMLALRVAAAMLYLASNVMWQNAVVAEVYALHAAAQAGCLWLAARLVNSPSRRTAGALAFSYGIAWQTHYLSIVIAPVVGLALVSYAAGAGFYFGNRMRLRAGGGGRLLRRASEVTLCFAIGISGLLYLPIRAAANPPMNWGDPATASRFVQHVSGGQFKQTKILAAPDGRRLEGRALEGYLRGRMALALGAPGAQIASPDVAYPPLGSFLGSSGVTAEPWALVFGGVYYLATIAGVVLLIGRNKYLGLGLLLTLAAGILVILVYSIEDIYSYLLGFWPVSLALAAYAAARFRPPLGASAGILLFGAMAVLAAALNSRACDVSNYRGAAEYESGLMDTLPPDALFLAQGDGTVFGAWHMKHVLGARPDVDVFGVDFIFQGWYADTFATDASRKLSVFSTQRPPGSAEEFWVALSGGIIAPNIAGRPIYAAVTDPWLAQQLRSKWGAREAAKLYGPNVAAPPIPAGIGAPVLLELKDNAAYRAQEAEQFARLFGASR